MAAKIFPAARDRISEIWRYTEKKWGEEQADHYVQGLVDAINDLRHERQQWKPVRDRALSGIFFFRYRHHYIFFRELSSASVGVISILRESMEKPSRLKDDAARMPND